MTVFFYQAVSVDITDTIKVKLRQICIPERIERIILLCRRKIQLLRTLTNEYIRGSNSNNYFRESTSDLVHARIQSKHTSAKLYGIWVEHDAKTVTG